MSFGDFLHRIQNETIEKIEEHEIIKAFEIFDIDGDGLDELASIVEETLLINGHQHSMFSARQRHVDALTEAEQLLAHALAQYNVHGAAELLSEDLKRVQTAIDTLTGKISSDDILGQIFSSFCIGK